MSVIWSSGVPAVQGVSNVLKSIERNSQEFQNCLELFIILGVSTVEVSVKVGFHCMTGIIHVYTL